MDLIDRQAAIDALWKALYEYEDKTEKQFIESEELDVGDWIQHRIFVQNMSDIDRQTILNLPSAEPNQWRTISKLPMDEEERKEWSEILGYDIEYDDAFLYYNLPNDGEEVIICTHSGYVCTDIFYNDSDGAYFDNYELDDVVAWMPLPKPWKGETNDN